MTNQTQVQWALANDGRTIHQDGKVVASIIERAHARQIVRAVNSHDDLLAALEAGLEHIERTCRTEHYISSTDDCQSCAEPAFDARAAIRRARGED